MTETQIFHLAPAVMRTYWLWLFALPAVFLAVVFVFVSYMVATVKNASIEIATNGAVRIDAGFYSREIPAADLVLESAKAIDLAEETCYAPSMRRNGVGLPGLQAGWFTLANGEKALIFITDPSRVVYATTRKNYSLLFSASDPQALLARLKSLASS